jgi:hypothetical protein
MENVSEGAGAPAEEPAAAEASGAQAPAAAGRRGALAEFVKGRAGLLLSGALIIAAAFWYLQFATDSICCGDYDAYYHFRWSRMLWDSLWAGNFPPSFDSLPLTTLNPRDYVDHHFLFHVFQIPFTLFPDFQTGAKVGTWLFACLAVFSCYWLVVRERLSYPLVWLVGILGSSAPFLYRIHMGKAMSVAIVLLVVGIYLLFERKYRWLLPLSYVFALTYDMVALLWVATAVWAGVMLWSERRFEWRALLFVGVGSVLGFVINPYFPLNVRLYYEHALMKVTAKDFSTVVGGEWYPYSSWEFLGNCGTAVVAMIAGYIAFRGGTRRESQRSLFFLVFATFLMLVNARWRRFSEYWPPFAILFAAFAIHPHVERVRARFLGRARVEDEDGAEAARDREPPRTAEALERARALEFFLVGTAVVLLAAPMYSYTRVTADDIAGMARRDNYRRGMEWVGRNVPAGELLYNADWDDFPKLFFYDPHRPYVAGLDPTYLLDRDRELMGHYERIGKGEEENPGPIIREKFCLGEGEARRCARYVFMDREHEGFYNNALDSGWFEVAYEDEDCSILRIRDAKGDPPPDNVPPGQQDADEGPPEADESGPDDEPQGEPGAEPRPN